MRPARTMLARLLLLSGVAGTLLWIVGCFRYTSLGLDTNVRRGEQGLVSYYRLRWPGDGSLWIGRSAQVVPLTRLSRYPLEPGGRLFAPPHRPEPRSRWNRLGFWWVHGIEQDPLLVLLHPDPRASDWLGLPGWLPALAALAGFCWARRTRRDPTP